MIISRISSSDFLQHEHALAGLDLDEAFLLQPHQRLANRRARDAELLRHAALVEPQVGGVVIDIHIDDSATKDVVDVVLQGEICRYRLELHAAHSFLTHAPAKDPAENGLMFNLSLVMWHTIGQQILRSGNTYRAKGRRTRRLSRSLGSTRINSHCFYS